MERAMGYVGEFADKAEDYQKMAEKFLFLYRGSHWKRSENE